MSRYVVVFEKFDKYVKSSFETRLGVGAVYRFQNGYGAEVTKSIFLNNTELWQVKLLGKGMGVYCKRCDPKFTEWMMEYFSVSSNKESEYFLWNLDEEFVEIVLEEIRRMKIPFIFRFLNLFK